MKKSRLFVMTVVCLVSTMSVKASLVMNPQKNYRIVCQEYGRGGVALGSEHSRQTALYYLVSSNDDEDEFWTFHEVAPGQYTIRNAKTGAYITYDGVYSGSYRRYVTTTTEARGDSSTWILTQVGNAYMIGCALEVDARYFNVRTNNYVVGTFGESTSSNELFTFYDEDGNLYTPEERNTTKCGTTLDGLYWENYGLERPIAVTEDAEDPIYYYIKNVRSGKYVWLDEANGRLSQSEDPQTQFYFVKGEDGINIYTADGYYVNGRITAKGQTNIRCVSGTTSTDDNTWGITYSANHGGYGIYVVTCSENEAGNTYIWNNQNFWNDYYQSGLCYYSLDGGSTFVFYSPDQRHQQLLAQQNVYVPDAGTGNVSQDLTSLLEGLYINGKTVVYDKLNRIYMMSAPEDVRKTGKYKTTIRFVADGEGYVFCVDGEPIGSDGSYTFRDITGGHEYKIALYYNDKEMGSARLTFTFMPIVEIIGSSFSSSYNTGYIRVNDPTYAAPIDSLYRAKFRYRGASARGKQKKSYAVKLIDNNGNKIDRRLLGLREDNNWILDAMAVDAGRMRNRVATDLWNDFSTAPYQSEFEKNVRNGTRGKFVEVLVNGSYAGLYCMTEKIDRKQLKLKKLKTAETANASDTIRGVLYKSSEWTYETFMGHDSNSRSYPMRSASSYSNYSDYWKAWELKYPDLDDGEPIDWGPLYRAVNVVAMENRSDFTSHVADYFDLPVFRDYYLFIEMMLATDNHGKNLYLSNYNMTKYNKMTITPWDLDGVFGRRWDGGTSLVRNAAQDFIAFLWAHEHGEYTIFKRLKDYNFQIWNNRLIQRYKELRPTYFSHTSLLKRFKDYRELFRDSGADKREIARWQGADGITMDFDAEITYLDSWLAQRLKALDDQYGYTVPDGVEVIKQEKYIGVAGGKGFVAVNVQEPQHVRIVSLTGVVMMDTQVKVGASRLGPLPAGIYLVNGKKVVVR